MSSASLPSHLRDQWGYVSNGEYADVEELAKIRQQTTTISASNLSAVSTCTRCSAEQPA